MKYFYYNLKNKKIKMVSDAPIEYDENKLGKVEADSIKKAEQKVKNKE